MWNITVNPPKMTGELGVGPTILLALGSVLCISNHDYHMNFLGLGMKELDE